MESWEKELLAAVTKLSRETFVGRAAAIDRDGSFPHANMADLRVLGVPGMTLPEALGGRAVGAEAQMRIIEEIAYGDGSTAVVLNMHLLVADFIAAFPPFPRRDTVLRDIATNNVLICAPGSVPTTEVDNRRSGYAVRDEGDAVVFNGKSGFASGSDGAKYTIIGGLIQHEGGDPDFVVTLPELSTQGINVLHNWDAMGLRGTASHDVLVEEMRIPKSAEPHAGGARHPGDMAGPGAGGVRFHGGVCRAAAWLPRGAGEPAGAYSRVPGGTGVGTVRHWKHGALAGDGPDRAV
ncbi:acyl-CoA/acyl-ACP dehydrogenase [bacterium]|nr:acyl-CoA/acyl-ACP dehydrogenase [bacterium]